MDGWISGFLYDCSYLATYESRLRRLRGMILVYDRYATICWLGGFLSRGAVAVDRSYGNLANRAWRGEVKHEGPTNIRLREVDE